MEIRNWRSKNIRRKECTILRIPKTPFPLKVYTVAFTNVGTTSWTAPEYCDWIEYLVVGGGGGGGGTYNNAASGGGGGGQVVQGVIKSVPYCCTYSVIVGSGGAGGNSYGDINGGFSDTGDDGGSSYFGTFLSQGGKGGLGSRYYIPTYPSGTGALNPSEGGAGGGGGGAGGGGGGSSAKGNDRTVGVGGTGGAGTVGTITGDTYGVGGNGGDRTVNHGTPLSPTTFYRGDAGAPNTGNGGAGSNADSASFQFGGDGGSGIVVIRYHINSHSY